MPLCASQTEIPGCKINAVTVGSPCGTPWQRLLGTRANALVVGPRSALDAFLRCAATSFRPPVVSVACRDGLALTRAETLVLRDVDRLHADDQARLTAWLDQPENASTQVISVTSIPLFDQVLTHRFGETLYYRLNTISLDVRLA